MTSQYKRGIIHIAVLIGLLCLFIVIFKLRPVSEPDFLLDVEAQCFIDNQKLILAEAEIKKEYIYYVNSISDYGGYQLGLSVTEIDNLFAHREKGKRIYNLKQFREITGVSEFKLDSIKHLLVFPKSKKLSYKKKITRKKTSVVAKIKRNINTVTSQELYARFQFPSKMANRIINYRKSIKGFQSMKQLNAVYYISEEQLKLLNIHYEVKK